MAVGRLLVRLPVGLEGKHEARAVGDEQDDGDFRVHPKFRLLSGSSREGVKDSRHNERHDAQEQHRRPETRRSAIETLDGTAQPSDQRRKAEDQQGVADDRAGQRCLDEVDVPRSEREVRR